MKERRNSKGQNREIPKNQEWQKLNPLGAWDQYKILHTESRVGWGDQASCMIPRTKTPVLINYLGWITFALQFGMKPSCANLNIQRAKVNAPTNTYLVCVTCGYRAKIADLQSVRFWKQTDSMVSAPYIIKSFYWGC